MTPAEWLEFASPESLRLLMYKRIIGARNVSLDDVPLYMDEFDDLEEYYFSKRGDPNRMKDARQRGLYEYTFLMKVPERPEVHVPYRLLSQLASVAPSSARVEFVSKRLESYGLLKAGSAGLERRVQWALSWSGRGGGPRKAEVRMTPKAKKAVVEFARQVASLTDAIAIQNAAFEAAKKHSLTPSEFFPAVYSILFGSDRGPRLGPYVLDAGPKAVSKAILESA